MKKLLNIGTCFLFFILSLFSANTVQAQCQDGDCWNGKGAYLYPSGATYVGSFRKGKIHGKGVLYFSNGNKYVGDWVEYYREGQGELYYTDGGHYKGEFQASKFQGKGVFTYANGDQYDGDWKNDLSEGNGIYAFKDGDRYEGEFKQGKFDGKGTMFYKDGAKFNGIWKKNKKDGVGLYVNKEGEQQHGVWAEGKLLNQVKNDLPIAENATAAPTTSSLRNCNTNDCNNGQGAFDYTDGSRYVGSFVAGFPQGEGTCFYANGDKYVGGWHENAPHGEGIMYFHYGKILGAKWDKGQILSVLHNSAEVNNIGDEYIEKDVHDDVKIWAVVVGVGRYEHMPTLKYTDDDAYRYYAFLKSPEGGALPDEQIRVLIDEDATRDNILRGMKQVFYQADANDVILFYFSGHGFDGSFIPSDYDGFNNLLYHTDVKKILEKSAARHKICFADACHSGSAGSTALAMRAPSEGGLDRYYKAFEKSRGGIALLLSSKGEEFSLEDEGLRQGIFSHYLMRGLKGEADTNKNKIVSIEEIYQYVHSKVKNYTASAQTPVLSGSYDKNMPVSVLR